MEIKPIDKFCLSIPEAAAYSMIGQDRIKAIIQNEPGIDWVLKVGSQTRIKRIPFEKWILQSQYL